jgi:amino acid transporter
MDALVSLVEQHNDMLLSYSIPAVAITVYLSTIVVLKLWMSTREKPFKVQSISAAHNFFLCVLSLAMAVGTSYEAFVVRAPQIGLGELFCSTDREEVFNNRLWFWCVVFYISKVQHPVRRFISALCSALYHKFNHHERRS